jgi:uncharacterized hydrophobic protein (TIGR00271 family)
MLKDLNPEEPKGNFFSRYLPRLERTERIALIERFESDARWNTDFVVMMGLASALASLGMLQNATAVVIGAMLVAPLMSPLLGAGFALVQGNLRLFRDSMRAMSYGVGIALLISLLLGTITPGSEMTIEAEARGAVDLLDLGIALASGMAAAYALARPSVAATLSGVAIAAALVPPLTVVGIAMSRKEPFLSGAAAVLFLSNLFGIVLGAALAFRLLGVHESLGESGFPQWVRRFAVVLLVGIVIMAIPLGGRLFSKIRFGQDRPLGYPTSREVREAITKRVQQEPGVQIVMMGRSAVEPEMGLQIYLVSDHPVPVRMQEDLQAIAHRLLGEKVPVRILVFKSAAEVPAKATASGG